jgi:hypothetical protein
MVYDVNLLSTQPCTTDSQFRSRMNNVIRICRTSNRLVSHRIKKTLVIWPIKLCDLVQILCSKIQCSLDVHNLLVQTTSIFSIIPDRGVCVDTKKSYQKLTGYCQHQKGILSVSLKGKLSHQRG